MSKTSRIRDNNMYSTVANFLKDKIQDGASLSFVSAYFTINAFNALRDSLTGIDNLRFLFGEPDVIGGMDPSKTESKAFRLTEEGLGLRNELSQNETAKACADWIEKKVKIKSVRKTNFLHGKMYYIEKDGSEDAIIGSSNFTVRGLGLSEKTSNIELNLEVDSKSDCADLKTWFDNLWESDQVVDVTDEVLQNLANAYQDKDPEFIYYKTLYHLFEDFLKDTTDAEFAQANPKFQETEIWQKLFAFQKHGVQACIQKLKTYNGCIIADSVGLGKTYEALAIIKYFELRNANVLVLCPKKLEQNWTLYSLNYNRKHNPLKKDNFRYSVRAHTDLTDRGASDYEWDAFDLVVIDESHNFRNRSTNKYDEDGNLIRKSRYNKLLEDIIQSGCKTQILMLSATPVNNRLTDLENQIRLITEDRDDAFQQTGIPSIRGTLNTAQGRFEKWTDETEAPNPSNRQESLSESLNADFFTLLDRLTIARSRTHIENFYGDTIDQIGGFPDRGKPQSIFPEIDLQENFPTYPTISTQIDGYKLARFIPSNYIRPECLHHYVEGLLRQREFNLIGMMKVNFLKRLESSVHSFATTLGRTIKEIVELESEIEAFLSGETEKGAGFDPLAEAEEEYNDGEDQELQAGIEAGKNQFYPFEHLDLDAWLRDLRNDKTQLEKIHKNANTITADRDAKLEELKQLILEKVQNPTTNKNGKENRKVLIFTAFADTANYLYKYLHEWATDTLNIECAVVTGSANRTTFGRNDFNEILTNFSPISKERVTTDTEEDTPEIDLLIATDCISEGQNLQDCDYLINYDIHWNPVRIIQRFGRIDRIGSRNTKVRLVNFWPTPELDEYINLKPRVEARMALVNLTATGDDDLLSLENRDDSLEQVWTHRDEQLRRMQTDILDFDDIEEQLNLNQFTLDDFRAQILKYLREDEAKLRDASLGLYAVTAPLTYDGVPVNIKPGVIFCLRQAGETEDNSEGEKLNPIHPYYLLHISDEGEVSIGFTNPKRILERLSQLCVGKTSYDQDLCHWFNEETHNGNDMTIYEMLIDAATDSIRQEYNRKVNDQLDASPDALLPSVDSQITEKTEFELVTWLVIRH
ncbi:MAG: helicase-related protein [Candidatus Poribacteria bacterium]|nr:helicase-related protein [Candidatus Poribacteria bacterium]